MVDPADDAPTSRPSAPRRRRVTGKPEAVEVAARRVFGREGYPRASIGAIAAEAGVSTRTIYNHFSGKDELFSTVLLHSGEQVADRLGGTIATHLDDVGASADDALRTLAHDWVRPLVEFADHFAVVRQVNAEAAHIPSELLEAWREAGPRRVERLLADRFATLTADGLLRTPDPLRAAVHYALLISGEVNARSSTGAVPLPDDERRACVDAGVDAFLRAYRPA